MTHPLPVTNMHFLCSHAQFFPFCLHSGLLTEQSFHDKITLWAFSISAASKAPGKQIGMPCTACVYGHHCSSGLEIRKRSGNCDASFHLVESFVHTFVHPPHLPCPCDTSLSCCLVTSQHCCARQHRWLPAPPSTCSKHPAQNQRRFFFSWLLTDKSNSE